MRINEIEDVAALDPNAPLPWNMVDDLISYMKNESGFYRKYLYPLLLDVQEAVANGGKYNKKDFIPIIDIAIKQYVKKFDIDRRPETVMSPADKMECVDKLLADEVENLKAGEY
jgi:hypothetical protein|tara:strand:+ start:72 stop:413 length:342 start_codon:yes stop_codon:yes gene_type:complete